MTKHRNVLKAEIIERIFVEHDIPYILTERPDLSPYSVQLQFTFDWCNGDIIMDTCSIFNAEKDPLVESYGFPWDKDDVTRILPEEMAFKVVNYYYGEQE